MPDRRGYADPADDGKKQYQRPKGTGSISKKRESDGRYQVSVVRADGKGRRTAWARTLAEAKLQLSRLRIEEGSTPKLFALADRFVEQWVAADGDDERRIETLGEFIKEWMGLRPEDSGAPPPT
jgi:hypothetical protein